jgi:predicted permease
MNLWLRAKSTIQNLFRKQHVESDLELELRTYVEMLTEEKIASGISEPEARRAALIEAGGIEQIKQSVRDQRAGAGLELLWQDVCYGLRQFRRYPGFSATVVFTLALSIGANTAIFSIVNALMLKSLPYPHPERMGTIYTRISGSTTSDERHHINGEQFELLRDNVPALVSAASGIRPAGVNLQTGSHIEYVRAGRISLHYLDVLDLHPLIGRNFSVVEDRPHGPKTVILSYGLWHSTFHSDRNILGRSILLKGEPYTVIGVLPEDAPLPLAADLYTALQPYNGGEGAGTNFEAITRLRDDATWQQADSQINHAWSLRGNRYEQTDNPGAHVSYYSVPLQKGETATLRPQVLSLMLAAGFILLIACANLAGLTLVRMLQRTAEVATRLALGASHWQIQRQFWIENLLLALIGGTAGVAAGFLALHGLLTLLPENFLPVSSVPLDIRVLAFTFLLSVLTSLLFGMLPALTMRKFDLRAAVTNRTATIGDRLGLRQVLIAGEVALTVVLLAASGLLIRTLVHLQTLPPGFNPNNVMAAKLSLDDVRYHDAAAFQKLLDESLASMRRIPGVEQAAVGLGLPYERSIIMGGISIKDGEEAAGPQVMADEIYTTPDYFSTLQIPLLSGRVFTDADGMDTQRVAIVNQTFARKFFHGSNPVGRHLIKDTVIVGMVEDVAMAPGIDPVTPITSEATLYIPATQMESQQLAMYHVWFQPSWIVRTAGPVEGLTSQMQSALSSADPNLPFSGFYRMSDLLAKTLATQRIEVALLSAMAFLALLLTAIGIFALIANIVGQKRREIGIRLALGSTLQQAMVHAGAPGLRASLFGIVLGLAACTLVLRVMHTVLYGIGVYDLPTLITVITILAAVTVLAAAVPTLRIAAINPAQTLREE